MDARALTLLSRVALDLVDLETSCPQMARIQFEQPLRSRHHTDRLEGRTSLCRPAMYCFTYPSSSATEDNVCTTGGSPCVRDM